MNKSQFPTMLKTKATLLGSLTRFDLGIVGGAYLLLSYFNIAGLWALAINAVLLGAIKFAQKQFTKGFLTGLRGERQLPWAYKLGDLKK